LVDLDKLLSTIIDQIGIENKRMLDMQQEQNQTSSITLKKQSSSYKHSGSTINKDGLFLGLITLAGKVLDSFSSEKGESS